MKVTQLFFFIILCFGSIAQEYPITWGEMERTPGGLLEILPKNNMNFFSLRWSGGSSFGAYRIVEHENLTMLQQKRIKPIVETGIANFETAFYFGKKLLLFMSDKSSGNMSLYLQELDEGLEPSGFSEMVASYPNNKLGAQPNFKIIESQNRKFIGIVWEIPGKRTNSDIYGYKVFNESLQIMQEGEYTMPFDGNMSTINEHHISNKGDYILSLTEHNKPNDRLFTRSYDNYKALHLYKIHQNELKEFTLSVDGLRIDDMQINSNDVGNITLTGLYGKGVRSGIEGLFIITIDASKDSIISNGIIPFDKEIAMETWSGYNDRSMTSTYYNPYSSNINTNTYNSPYYNYKLRDIFIMEDGSMTGSMEQYYVYRRSNYDTRTGVSSNVTYYYYDDIIAFKVGVAGTFDWQKRIKKSQMSLNDGGPFSSYCSFSDGKTLSFIFNDNTKNYEESGEYAGNDNRIYSFNLSKRRNAAAIANLDLKTGNVVRKTLFTRKELNSIVVPKMFKLDLVNKEILMYAILGNKERFGILNFKIK